jgi:hypothetical protein
MTELTNNPTHPDVPELPEWRAAENERRRQKFVPTALYPTIEEWAAAGFPALDTLEDDRGCLPGNEHQPYNEGVRDAERLAALLCREKAWEGEE